MLNPSRHPLIFALSSEQQTPLVNLSMKHLDSSLTVFVSSVVIFICAYQKTALFQSVYIMIRWSLVSLRHVGAEEIDHKGRKLHLCELSAIQMP